MDDVNSECGQEIKRRIIDLVHEMASDGVIWLPCPSTHATNLFLIPLYTILLPWKWYIYIKSHEHTQKITFTYFVLVVLLHIKIVGYLSHAKKITNKKDIFTPRLVCIDKCRVK